MTPSFARAKSPPYRIQIDGVRSEQEVWDCSAAAVDAVGFCFDPTDPGFVPLDLGEHLQRTAHIAGLTTVGVFGSASPDAIRRVVKRIELDVLELADDAPASLLRELEGRTLVRTLRLAIGGDADLEALVSEAAALWKHAGAPARLSAIRVELTSDPTLFVAGDRERIVGSSGVERVAPGRDADRPRGVDWSALARRLDRPELWPLILSGGLSPENVADAIHAVRPAAVVAGRGVEASPGVKSLERMKAFSLAAKRAFREIRTR